MGPRSMDPNIPGSMNPSIQGSMDPSMRGSMDQFQGRPGMNISKVEEGVDPLGDESQVNKMVVNFDLMPIITSSAVLIDE